MTRSPGDGVTGSCKLSIVVVKSQTQVIARIVVLLTAKPSLQPCNTIFHGHTSLKSVLLLPSAGITGVRHHTPDSVYVCRLAGAACDVDY